MQSSRQTCASKPRQRRVDLYSLEQAPQPEATRLALEIER
jgi:hypothetical protein